MACGHLAQGLLQQCFQLLQLIVVQHPVAFHIFRDVRCLEHPSVFQLFKDEVLGIKAGHGQRLVCSLVLAMRDQRASVVLRSSFHLSHDRAVLASRRSPLHLLSPSAMAAFSVFFCDQERCSIQPVRAMDPDHAIALVRRSIPDLKRVAVVPDELLEGVDPIELLEQWIQARA